MEQSERTIKCVQVALTLDVALQPSSSASAFDLRVV